MHNYNQHLLEAAELAAALYEKIADLTAYPDTADGRPSEANCKELIKEATELAKAIRQGVRWTRRSGSRVDGFTVQELIRGFQRVYENTTVVTQHQFVSEADEHAQRALARRPDRDTLTHVTGS